MEIITGYTGKPHVTSDQGRDVNIGIMGEGSYVLQTGMQLVAEVSSNNEIKIRDGVLMHQGCTASIKKNTYDSLTITNGSQGMKRVDLIVARYEKNQDNGIESLDLKVIQGTPAESNPAAPQYTEGDIQAGDYVADMPMYQVIIEGLNITAVEPLFNILKNMAVLQQEIAQTNKELARMITHKLLYYNAGGTTGTFTLSDSVKNYDYIEIFYNSDVAGHKAPQKSIKLPTSQTVSSGDMLFDMTSFRMSSGDGTKMQLMNTILNVSGKTCKPETSRQINFGSTAGSVAWTVSNTPHHRVYRVVGYNYGS